MRLPPELPFKDYEFCSLTLNGDSNTIVNTYADGEKFSGSVTVDGLTVALNNCFWTADLGFYSPAAGDYRLRLDSPLINGLDLIGCEPIASQFDSQHPAFDPSNAGVVLDNLTRNLDGSFDPVNASLPQRARSTEDPALAIRTARETELRDSILILADYQPFNGEGIDGDIYDPGLNDEVRPTYLVRVYDLNEPFGTNSLLNWGPWIKLEWDMPGEVDGSGRGNGDVDADLSGLNPIIGQVFQFDITYQPSGVW